MNDNCRFDHRHVLMTVNSVDEVSIDNFCEFSLWQGGFL